MKRPHQKLLAGGKTPDRTLGQTFDRTSARPNSQPEGRRQTEPSVGGAPFPVLSNLFSHSRFFFSFFSFLFLFPFFFSFLFFKKEASLPRFYYTVAISVCLDIVKAASTVSVAAGRTIGRQEGRPGRPPRLRPGNLQPYLWM